MSRQKLATQNEDLRGLEEDQPKTGLIGSIPEVPKRSESQKIRGNSQHHFLKRKDGVAVIENQQQEIKQVLQNNQEHRDNSSVTREEKKRESPAVPAKEPEQNLDDT